MSRDWLTYCPGPPRPSPDYVTPSFLRGTEHYTPYLMGTPGHPASSAHLAINMARVCLTVHPFILGSSCHVTSGSRDSTYVTPWPLWQGLVVVVVVPLSHHEGDWHRLSRRLQLCCYITNVVNWVVQRSNHRAVLSLATTSPDAPSGIVPSHSSKAQGSSLST
jgi:hypothetical protein